MNNFRLPFEVVKQNPDQERTGYKIVDADGLNVCSLSSMKMDGNRHPDTCEFVAYWANRAFGYETYEIQPRKPRGLKLPFFVSCGSIYDNKGIVIGSDYFFRHLGPTSKHIGEYISKAGELQFILDCCFHKSIYC